MSTSWVLIIGGLLAFAAIVLTARFVLSATRVKPWVRYLGIAQTLITIAAAIVAASWYFVDRPHAVKLKIEQTATGVPLPDGQVMILDEITISNVSASTYELKRAPYRIMVQKITPLPEALKPEIGQLAEPGVAQIHPADDWAKMAQIKDKLDTVLEAGETENLYFRVVLRCQPALRVYLTSWLTKPKDSMDLFEDVPDLTWIKQTYLDLSTACPAAKAPAQTGRSGRKHAPHHPASPHEGGRH